MSNIKDGTGKGYLARVDEENALLVQAITTPHISHESQKDGTAFILSTGGFISITQTEGFSAVLYFKNNDERQRHFIIERIRLCGGGGMDAHSTVKAKFLANCTAGTIISDAVAGEKANANISSRNEFEGFVYTGGDNKTATGGTFLTQIQCHINGESQNQYYGSLVLGKGDSVTILVQPTEAYEMCVEILGYYESYEIN